MSPEFKDAKAVVYLYKAGNHRNKIILLDKYLVVIYRGSKNTFRLEDIAQLYFTRHKILIPIILGGITASFSLIAIFVAYYSPLLIISIFVTGVLVLYLGYNGEDVLVIDLKVKQEFFPLQKVSDNLRAFVHFVNQFLKAGNEKIRWCIFLPLQSEIKQQQEQKSPLQAFTYEQMQQQKSKFSEKNDKTFVALDPFQLGSEVKFEKLPGKSELYPMIYGNINQEAIVKDDDVE